MTHAISEQYVEMVHFLIIGGKQGNSEVLASEKKKYINFKILHIIFELAFNFHFICTKSLFNLTLKNTNFMLQFLKKIDENQRIWLKLFLEFEIKFLN